MRAITTTALLVGAISSASATDKATYQDALQALSNQKITVEKVNDTPVAGIKEIILSGGAAREVLYLSADGEYMFDGKLMNLKSRKNLTDATQKSLRNELMTEFKKTHKSIDFLPEQMTDHITVFTDIDCGYCRKLHQEVKQYNDLGIGISYLFFPRAGLNSASHQKAVNVWCASDQQKAMTQAKNGELMEPLMCPNPLESQYNLGLGAGIHKLGTPTVVFEDGSVLRGYLPPERLKERINQVKAAQ